MRPRLLRLTLTVLALSLALAGSARALTTRPDIEVITALWVPVLAVRPIVGTYVRNLGAPGPLIVERTAALAPAFHAVPPTAPIGVEVRAGQLMPVHAVGLLRLQGGWGFPSQQVHAMRDRLQMPGVAARTVPAEVVDLVPVGDWSDQQLVGGAVRLDASSVERGIPVPRSRVAVARIRPAPIWFRDRGRDVPRQQSLAHAPIYCRRALKAIHREVCS